MQRLNRIKKLAYTIYKNTGYRKERDLENWLEAERIVRIQEMHKQANENWRNIEEEFQECNALPTNEGRLMNHD